MIKINKEKKQKESYKMSTNEAKKLIDMLKERVSTTLLKFPSHGKKIEFDVFAKEDGSKFIINISRGSINNKDLYTCCIEFFRKFNILEDSCKIIYQTELKEDN